MSRSMAAATQRNPMVTIVTGRRRSDDRRHPTATIGAARTMRSPADLSRDRDEKMGRILADRPSLTVEGNTRSRYHNTADTSPACARLQKPVPSI